ncbi:methionine--tRNA ligase [Sulfolobales archaeon HS-7]|nr:methionine--tRNA ligase [Sulfolobales archaeon HS-7]
MSEQIDIEYFGKLDLRIGVVKEAERIEGTKLLKLVVDIGSEYRQIISGIADYYEPSSLVNKRVVVITNLRTKRIRGYESQGMILAAGCKDDEEKGIRPQLLTTDNDVQPGTRIC